MRKLIPNNINVSEQLRIRNQFVSVVDNWRRKLPVNLEWLERDSGVRCHYTNTGVLAGFKIVDEKMYAWFILRWS